MDEPEHRARVNIMGILAMIALAIAFLTIMLVRADHEPPPTGGVHPIPVPPAQESDGVWIGKWPMPTEGP